MEPARLYVRADRTSFREHLLLLRVRLKSHVDATRQYLVRCTANQMPRWARSLTHHAQLPWSTLVRVSSSRCCRAPACFNVPHCGAQIPGCVRLWLRRSGMDYPIKSLRHHPTAVALQTATPCRQQQRRPSVVEGSSATHPSRNDELEAGLRRRATTTSAAKTTVLCSGSDAKVRTGTHDAGVRLDKRAKTGEKLCPTSVEGG